MGRAEAGVRDSCAGLTVYVPTHRERQERDEWGTGKFVARLEADPPTSRRMTRVRESGVMDYLIGFSIAVVIALTGVGAGV